MRSVAGVIGSTAQPGSRWTKWDKTSSKATGPTAKVEVRVLRYETERSRSRTLRRSTGTSLGDKHSAAKSKDERGWPAASPGLTSGTGHVREPDRKSRTPWWPGVWCMAQRERRRQPAGRTRFNSSGHQFGGTPVGTGSRECPGAGHRADVGWLPP